MRETQLVHRTLMALLTIIAALALNMWWMWIIAAINLLLIAYWIQQKTRK